MTYREMNYESEGRKTVEMVLTEPRSFHSRLAEVESSWELASVDDPLVHCQLIRALLRLPLTILREAKPGDRRGMCVQGYVSRPTLARRVRGGV